MTEIKALKIASWLITEDLCHETSEYCGKSCTECEKAVRKTIRRMIARKEKQEKQNDKKLK